eukprot:3916224-Prymnesium_polylepis.1
MVPARSPLGLGHDAILEQDLDALRHGRQLALVVLGAPRRVAFVEGDPHEAVDELVERELLVRLRRAPILLVGRLLGDARLVLLAALCPLLARRARPRPARRMSKHTHKAHAAQPTAARHFAHSLASVHTSAPCGREHSTPHPPVPCASEAPLPRWCKPPLAAVAWRGPALTSPCRSPSSSSRPPSC